MAPSARTAGLLAGLLILSLLLLGGVALLNELDKATRTAQFERSLGELTSGQLASILTAADIDESRRCAVLGELATRPSIGIQALDAAIVMLKTDTQRVRLKAIQCVHKHRRMLSTATPIIPLLADENERIRALAVVTIVGLRGEDQAIATFLKKILFEDTDEVSSIAEELSKDVNGKVYAWYFVEMLKSHNRWTRIDGLSAMLRLGLDNSVVVDHIVAMLDDPEEAVRSQAIQCLSECGTAARSALPHLRCLSERNSASRALIQQAIRQIEASAN